MVDVIIKSKSRKHGEDIFRGPVGLQPNLAELGRRGTPLGANEFDEPLSAHLACGIEQLIIDRDLACPIVAGPRTTIPARFVCTALMRPMQYSQIISLIMNIRKIRRAGSCHRRAVLELTTS